MNKKRLSLIGALALVALGTMALVKYVSTAEDRALAGEELIQVLVVQQNIPAGTSATELAQYLRLESVPVKVQASGALASLGEAENLVTAVDLIKGEQLTAARLIDPVEYQALNNRVGRGGGAVTVPEGMLEVTIPLDPIRTVGGTVRPGDLVGVIVAFDGAELLVDPNAELGIGSGGEPDAEDIAGMILHKVLVTNVQGVQVADPTREATAEERAPVPQGTLLVTLAVDAPSVEKIVYASNYGDVWLALEPADANEDGTRVQTLDKIFDQVER